MDKTALRDAATIILLRDRAGTPSVLMGQRGAGAVFMPGKFVFPGGAVDGNDALVPLASPVSEPTATRLEMNSTRPGPARAAAAIRELWEETGQILGARASWPDPPKGWRGFAGAGYVPTARDLHFVFRAITPPGRPRRFDARFFLAEAETLASDPDDFSRAEDELSHLQWVPLHRARDFDLPFITQVVLAEIAGNLDRPGAPADVPFIQNKDEANLILRLGGRSPLDGN
jgi:8-oxo-dGTP pyrophosphatase MutT (NUDIX family)